MRDKSEISTPSTKTRALPPFNEVLPRMLILAAWLGCPLLNVIFKLGTIPCKPCAILPIGRFSRISPEAVVTAPVKLSFFCVP